MRLSTPFTIRAPVGNYNMTHVIIFLGASLAVPCGWIGTLRSLFPGTAPGWLTRLYGDTGVIPRIISLIGKQRKIEM